VFFSPDLWPPRRARRRCHYVLLLMSRWDPSADRCDETLPRDRKWVNFNRNQSNLAKGGIAVASPPNSLFVFARRQHRTDGLAAICNCMFWLRIRSQIPLPLWARDRHLTQCVIGPHKRTVQMAAESVERVKQGTRMWQATDRQITLRRYVEL